MPLRQVDRCELLLGRDTEQAALRDAVATADRIGQAIVIVGDAGTGKTSLLRTVICDAHARDYSTVVVAGESTRAAVPYSGLHTILLPFRHLLGGAPSEQQRTIDAACDPERAGGLEPAAVAWALLSLVRAATPSRPVVLAVDDMHRLDTASLAVLGEIGRLAAADAILVVATTRDVRYDVEPLTTASILKLCPLEDQHARELLQRSGRHLAFAQREHILRCADGNPLALVELPRALGSTADVVTDIHLRRMPVTRELQRSFAQGLGDLAPAARDAVLVAALEDDSSVHELVAATRAFAADDTLGVDVFDTAIIAGVLTGDDLQLHFRHGLTRAAVLHEETLARRQRARRAIAEVVGAGPRRTWHEAQSLAVTHEDLGDSLEQVYEVARGRTVVAGVATLERAAQLTADPRKRARRLLRAAEDACALGRDDVVERYIGAAGELDGEQQALADVLRIRTMPSAAGDGPRISALCRLARQANRSGDPDLALSLLLAAAERAWWTDADSNVRDEIDAARRETVGTGNDARVALVLAFAAPLANGRAVADVLERSDGGSDPVTLRNLGFAAHLIGDCPSALALLVEAEAACRTQGLLGLLPQVLCIEAAARIELGDWDRAERLAVEAVELAEGTAQWNWIALSKAHLARAHALRNNVALATQIAGESERLADQRGLPGVRAFAAVARGAASLSAGRHVEGFEELAMVYEDTRHREMQRERLSAIMLAVEAAVRTEQIDAGRALLAKFEARTPQTPSPLLLMQLLYARACLAGDDEADARFQQALGHDLVRWPWVRARIELAYGSWLRRQRRVVESRSRLRSACSTFELIGAIAWAEQARTELRAAGERRDQTGFALEEMLSPQEQEIARLAGAGLSNREIGQRLLLSHRTVGAHLYRIFPKLGITSRRQLVMHLGSDGMGSLAVA
jgi:DNA-binding CsgD family transcriptional regulator